MENSAILYEVKVERQVPIPMSDGTILRADMYQPTVAGRYPALVERVAYDVTWRCQYAGEYYASRGYVVIGQHVRGRFGSQGTFSPFRDDAWGEHRDGYDTIEWITQQPWSNGNVGMLDGSYSGGTQYLVTPTQPKGLKALFVREGMSDIYRDFVFRGGAYGLLHRQWAMTNELAVVQSMEVTPERAEIIARLQQALEHKTYWQRYLPLHSCPPLEGLEPWYFEHMQHPEDGPYWWGMNLSRQFDEVDIPILHVGGWFDCFLDSTLRCFQGIQAAGKSEQCRQAQRLIVGPWIHGPDQIGKRQVGEIDFGPEAGFDLHGTRLQWYDYWLKEETENGAMTGPAVRLFLMGANRWIEADTWPLSNVTYRPLYFHSGSGQTEHSLNNGQLTFEMPSHNESADTFVYDPENPVESIITYPGLGPKDHRSVEGKMLTYTTDVLEKELTVIGPIKAVLHASSSAVDTDWVVRLCDVLPDGRSMSLCDGILRARYRHSLERAELLEPGQVYQFEIDTWATAHVFQVGHRLRVEVTSSDFPRYDRNMNTGAPFGTDTHGYVAHNTVWHDQEKASYIMLPVAVGLNLEE